MASSSASGDDSRQEIRLVSEGDGWVATDVETGVTSQGETREVALENLDNAVAAHREEGRPPTDDELRELDIDPADNVTGEREPPNVLA